jgi:hypothetical protein
MTDKKIVYVRLNGRLGNYLFQIAAAASLAARNQAAFAAVCHENYLLPPPHNCSIFQFTQQFKSSIFRSVEIIEAAEHKNIYVEKTDGYADIPYTDEICLVGSFQSEKYFDAEVVRDLFEIPAALRANLLSKYGGVLAQGVTSVHVRRGDYLKLPHEYNITSKRFFQAAMEKIGQSSPFLLISDDIEWCRDNFKGANFSFAAGGTALEDLYLQSLCANNIISNSTFSWWGAWLNTNPAKQVIAPRPWYGKDFSHIHTADLVPTTWVQLDNRMDLVMRLKAEKILALRYLKGKARSLVGR